MVAEVGKTNRQRLTVGIHEEEGGAAREGGMTSAAVAFIHEFGAEAAGIPERSWLRGALEQHRREIEDEMRRLAALIVRNRLTSARAHDLLGARIVSLIQRRIRDGTDPPLAPATIARKGSSVPLIDTGQLIQEIRHRVT